MNFIVIFIVLTLIIIGGVLFYRRRKAKAAADADAKIKAEAAAAALTAASESKSNATADSDSDSDAGDMAEEAAKVITAKPEAAPKAKTYSLRDAQTPANDWGGGNSIFLDRHTLDCGDDGINQFKLGRPKNNQIQYSYKCVEGVNSPANINKDTGANDWGGGNAIFLDRHNVDCGKNPISKFRLVRPKPNQIRYDYTCNSAEVKGQCRDANSGWNQESNMNIYLDRHNVACKDTEVITQFKLNRDGKGKFRYDYKCCQF